MADSRAGIGKYKISLEYLIMPESMEIIGEEGGRNMSPTQEPVRAPPPPVK